MTKRAKMRSWPIFVFGCLSLLQTTSNVFAGPAGFAAKLFTLERTLILPAVFLGVVLILARYMQALPRKPSLCLLHTFKYCLPKNARADIVVTIGDLEEDIHEMLAARWTGRRIHFIVLIRSLQSILPIVWGTFTGLLNKLCPVLTVLNRFNRP